MSAATNSLETMLRGAGGDVARVMVRMERRALLDAQREQLIAWGAFLRINRGLAVNTVGNYLDDVAEFCEWINRAGITLELLSPAHVEVWQQHLFIDRNESSPSRGLKLVCLRRFYAWREQMGQGVSPVRSVQGPKKQHRIPRKYSSQQLMKIFRACDRGTVLGRRDFSILMFLYGTGARRMEIDGLTLSQLTLRERVGSVNFLGKGNKERIVSFEGPVVEALRAWLADRDALGHIEGEAVWTGLTARHKGKRLREGGVYNVIARAIRVAGLKNDGGAMGVHRMRVTFATDLYDQGVDIDRVRRVMGHDDIETTRGYIAISEKQLKTRMSSERLREVSGEKMANVPAWAKRKMGGPVNEQE